MNFLNVIVAVVAVALCSSGGVSAQDKTVKAIAIITGTGVSGNVSFSQTGCTGPVLVEVYLTGLTPGDRGFHVHEKGDLSEGCLSTGAHYNPDKLDHGAPTDEIRHVGDLGNVKANAQGIVSTSFSDSVLSLVGARSILGRAVVVHADVDDLGKTTHPDSKKTGNAGSRLGCGVIGLAFILKFAMLAPLYLRMLPNFKSGPKMLSYPYDTDLPCDSGAGYLKPSFMIFLAAPIIVSIFQMFN